MQHANWISQARQHWSEHRPAMVAQMVSKGILEQQLTQAAEATAQQMQTLVGQGLSQLQAWEMTRELFLFPAEEPSASEQTPTSSGLKAQRELNDGLRYLGMTDEEIAISKALDE